MPVEPVTEIHAQIARHAYQNGKGSGHPARLNFGDCFAYALAKESNEPLAVPSGVHVHDLARAHVLALQQRDGQGLRLHWIFCQPPSCR